MSTTGAVTLDFLARRQEKILGELGEMRARMQRIESNQLSLLHLNQNLGSHVADMRQDLEATIKIEIGGAIANLETRLDNRFDRFLEDLRNPNAPD